MCRCTPNKRTPWCGAPGCEDPEQRARKEEDRRFLEGEPKGGLLMEGRIVQMAAGPMEMIPLKPAGVGPHAFDLRTTLPKAEWRKIEGMLNVDVPAGEVVERVARTIAERIHPCLRWPWRPGESDTRLDADDVRDIARAAIDALLSGGQPGGAAEPD